MQTWLNRSNYAFTFVGTNLFRNYFCNDTNGPPYKRDITVYNPRCAVHWAGGAGSFSAEWLSTPGISCSVSSNSSLAYPTSCSANLTLFLQLHVLNIIALALVAWFWESHLEYKVWEWERRSHWCKNVYGNAVPTQKYIYGKGVPMHSRSTTPLEVLFLRCCSLCVEIGFIDYLNIVWWTSLNMDKKLKLKNESDDDVVCIYLFTFSCLQWNAINCLCNTLSAKLDDV